MKIIKTYKIFESTIPSYKAQKRYTYGTMRFAHEYFTIRSNDKIVASCVIVYPSFSPNKSLTTSKKHGCWTTNAGSTEIFDDKNGNFIMLYEVKARKTGQGWGKILFEKLIEYLKSKGIEKIYLDVDVDNTRAQKFYKAMGFKLKYKETFDYRYYLPI